MKRTTGTVGKNPDLVGSSSDPFRKNSDNKHYMETSMAISDSPSRKGVLIERRSIDYIPDNERHGSPLSQFTLWISANLTVTCAVTGALTVVLGGDVFQHFGNDL